ncbi:MAG: hypothetical protein EOM02_08875 [Synergistales bacterium]|nr:hypothetical protein [Synergistales bacterium]
MTPEPARAGANIEEAVRRLARARGIEVPSVSDIRRSWNTRILAYVRQLYGRSIEWHLLVGAQDYDNPDYDLYVDATIGHDRCMSCKDPSRCPMEGRKVEIFQSRYYRGVCYNEDVYVAVRPPRPNCRDWCRWAKAEWEKQQAAKVVTVSSLDEGF